MAAGVLCAAAHNVTETCLRSLLRKVALASGARLYGKAGLEIASGSAESIFIQPPTESHLICIHQCGVLLLLIDVHSLYC